jgi:uncharacterized membrane protein HdeD (DUF308 family)
VEGEVDVFTRAQNLENWQLILAFFLPLVIAMIVRQNWSRTAKSITMFVVALLATIGTMFLNGSLNDVSAETFVGKFLVVVVGTIAFYNGIWKPTQVAPKIEDATG